MISRLLPNLGTGTEHDAYDTSARRDLQDWAQKLSWYCGRLEQTKGQHMSMPTHHRKKPRVTSATPTVLFVGVPTTRPLGFFSKREGITWSQA
jgi:hypothetical protein